MDTVTLDRTRSIRELAQWYHELGMNVCPLGDDKRPVITGIWKGNPTRFRWDAWQDTPQTDALWKQIRAESYWTECHGVALINGFGGWVNIDIDALAKADGTKPPVPRSVAEQFLFALDIPATYPWLVSSPTGGWHIFARVQSLDLDKGRLDQIMPGEPSVDHVELRHYGHYTVLPGSAHPSGKAYAWANGQPTEPPPWIDGEVLLAAYRSLTQPRPAKKHPPTVSQNGNGAYSPYVAKAFDNEIANIAAAQKGSRNDTLLRSAFALGQLAIAGGLSFSACEERMAAAANWPDESDEQIRATIRSGWDAGLAKPRDIPDNGRQHRDKSAGDDLPDLFAAELPEHWGEDGSAVSGGVPWPYAHDLLYYRAEEAGLLDCWRELYESNRIYAKGFGWLSWTGTHWQREPETSVAREVIDILNTFNREARARLAFLPPPSKGQPDEFETERKALGSMVAATRMSIMKVGSIEALAREFCRRRIDDLNSGNLLNLGNGTLDLDALRLRGHCERDLLTDCLPYAYAPNAQCPRWKQFLDEVLVYDTQNADGTWTTNRDVVALMQEAIGYTLTTDTSRHVMFMLLGDGRNGKSTAISILQHLVGSLACNVDFQSIGQPGNYDLAAIPGKRMIFSTEARRNGSMAEGLIKELVAGDTLRAREIREAAFEFTPIAKIWWAMNDKPRITDTSKGIWQRLVLIPFNRSFAKEERDLRLRDTLLGELPGILNWALDGLRRLRNRGDFDLPEAVTRAVEEYQKESNPVMQWLEERTIREGDDEWESIRSVQGRLSTPAADCYQSYSDWAAANGRMKLSSTSFGTELGRLTGKKRTMTGVEYPVSLRAGGQRNQRETPRHWGDDL